MLLRCPDCGHGKAIQPIRSASIIFKVCSDCVELAHDLGVDVSARGGIGRRGGLKILSKIVGAGSSPVVRTNIKKGENK